MDKKWWLIGGGGIIILFLLLYKGQGLPSSQAGSSTISVPNTQDIAASNSLADAIAQFNGAVHDSNVPAGATGSTGAPVAAAAAPSVAAGWGPNAANFKIFG
jgi:hypothetical protein